MNHQNLSHEKWEAKVSTKLEKAKADRIWLLFEDFFGLNKWFPGLAACHGIQGTNGEPGCIRYCAGFSVGRREVNKSNSSNESDNSSLRWSKERLVTIDRAQMTLSYEIVDCNIGFKSYFSTIRVVPSGEGGGGCTVEWCFSLEPVEGCKKEDLVGKYQVGLQLMAKKMEASLFEHSS